MGTHGEIHTDGGADTPESATDTSQTHPCQLNEENVAPVRTRLNPQRTHTKPTGLHFSLDQGKDRFVISNGKATQSFKTLLEVAAALPPNCELGFERSLAGGGNKRQAGEMFNTFLDALLTKGITAWRCSTRCLLNARHDSGIKIAKDVKTDERDAMDLWPIFYATTTRRKVAKRWAPIDSVFASGCKELDQRFLDAKNNGWKTEMQWLRERKARMTGLPVVYKSAVVVARFVLEQGGARKDFDNWSGLTEFGRPSTHRANAMRHGVKGKSKTERKQILAERRLNVRAIFALMKYGQLGTLAGADTNESATDTPQTHRRVPPLFYRRTSTNGGTYESVSRQPTSNDGSDRSGPSDAGVLRDGLTTADQPLRSFIDDESQTIE